MSPLILAFYAFLGFPHAPFTPELHVDVKPKIQACIARLEDRFGKHWEGKFPKVTLVQGDTTSCGGGAMGCTSSPRSIELREEPFASGYGDFDLTLCHEAAHAFFRRFDPHYSKLPRWAREGSAVYLSGQTDDKVLTQIFSHPENPAAGLNGLEGKHGFDDYFEDALAFRFLGAKADPVLARVLDGADIYEAIQAETGLDREKFLAGALENARTQLTPSPEAAAGFSVYQELQKVRYRDPARAIVLARELLETVPKAFYARKVALVRYDLAGLSLAARDFATALEQYSTIYTVHFEQPHLRAASSLGMGRTYFAAGKWKSALRWLAPQRLEGSFVDDEIRYMEGLSLHHLGHCKAGMKLLHKVASKPPREVWGQKAREALSSLTQCGLSSK